MEQVAQAYDALHANGVAIDLVGPGSDLSGYDVLAAPVLYLLSPDTVDALHAFVARGGQLVTTFLGGVADPSDRIFPGGPPGPLRDLLGFWVEEIDALPPGVTNQLVLPEPLGELSGAYSCNLLFNIVRPEGAEVLGTYGADFYAGTPALTRHAYGEGHAWHVASSAEQAFLRGLFGHLCKEKRIEPVYPDLPFGVEASVRGDGDDRVLFLLNHGSQPASVPLVTPVSDLLRGVTVEGEAHLPPYGVLLARLPAAPAAGQDAGLAEGEEPLRPGEPEVQAAACTTPRQISKVESSDR